MTTVVLAGIVGFLAGSIPFGLLLAKLAGSADPRSAGSGNVGATNLARTGGLHLGLLTLLLDAAKGALPAWWFLGQGGEAAGVAAGLAAVFGHCFSPWLRFQGGKGVATLLGVVAVLLWPIGLLVFAAVWLLLFAALRWASVASLAAAWALPVLAWVQRASLLLVGALALAALVVTFRHGSNLRRLFAGEEPRLGAKPIPLEEESLSPDRTSPAAVLGAGSWGTALAVLLARSPGALEVRLWCRSAESAAAMERERENRRYLPGVRLPDPIRPVTSLAEALEGARLVVGAVPSKATGELAREAAPLLDAKAVWLSTAKGLEVGTNQRMSEVVREAAPDLAGVAVLSGPSFAAEVAAGQPTAVVVACEDLALARDIQAAVSDETFRAYASTDLVGVELGAAVKNVVAIAAGLLAGLGLGHDPTAALITRGLAEMTRLAVALGAEERTLFGLAGLGDLVLTCTGSLSRNCRLGEAIGSGRSLDEAVEALGQVAEGVGATVRVLELSRELGVEVPITQAVHDVLFGGIAAEEAVRRLMLRDLRDEGA